MVSDDTLKAFQTDVKALEAKHGVKLMAEAFIHNGIVLGRLALLDKDEVSDEQVEEINSMTPTN